MRLLRWGLDFRLWHASVWNWVDWYKDLSKPALALMEVQEGPCGNFNMLPLLCHLRSVFKKIYSYWISKKLYWYMTIESVIFPFNQGFFLLWSWWSISIQSIGLDPRSIWTGGGEIVIHLIHISKCYIFTIKPGLNWFSFGKCLPSLSARKAGTFNKQAHICHV